MADFTPIESQEAFDAAIKDRIARAEKTAEARVRAELQEQLNEIAGLKDQATNLTAEKSALETTVKENTEKISGLESQLAEALAKNKGFEMDALKIKVITEKGLPLEFKDRIIGDTEEALFADAEKLAKTVHTLNSQGLPLANLEPSGGDYSSTGKLNQDRAMQKFAQALNAINE